MTNADLQTQLDSIVKEAHECIKNFLNDITRNRSQFYKFAYELRKFDKEDQFTKELLKQYVKPFFIQILLSNKWNQQTKKMEVDINNYQFNI